MQVDIVVYDHNAGLIPRRLIIILSFWCNIKSINMSFLFKNLSKRAYIFA